MKKSLVSLLGIALPAAFVTSCGPMYETRYDYIPPEGNTGRACIFQCETVKMQCEQIEDMREQNCEERAEWERLRCEDDLRRRGKKGKWYDCSSSSCSSDTARCDENYRRCYQSCGGSVKTTQVCVFNCGQK